MAITKVELTDYILTSNMNLLNDTINGIPSEDILKVILVPLVYLVGSLVAGLYIFKKRDI